MRIDRFAVVKLGAQEKLQSHQGFEFRYILGGKGRMKWDQGRSTPAQKGDLIWNGPYQPHILSGEPEVVAINFWLELGKEFDNQLIKSLNDVWTSQRRLHPGEGYEIQLHKWRLNWASSSLEIKRTTEYLVTAWVMDHIFCRAKTVLFSDPIVKEVTNRLALQPVVNHDFRSMAAEFHLSQSQLNRRFQKELGIAPKQFLIGLRLDEAKRLLLHTNSTLDEIARRTGTGDAYSFSKIFSRHFNVSPGSLRKK